MVHALSEIRRILVPEGILIDLRPIQDRWGIEVISVQEFQETSKLLDDPGVIADDKAANRAMAHAEQAGWLARDREELFSYDYIWDTPSEMEEWIAAEWYDFVAIDEESKRATRSAWALAGPDAQVRVRVKMLITRWKVVKEP